MTTLSIHTLTNHIRPIISALPIDLVYLHGSVAHGKQDALSDYDFGVLFSPLLDKRQRGILCFRSLRRLDPRYT